MSTPVWAQDAPAASQDQTGTESTGQEYGGPSVLSRGSAPGVIRNSELGRITPFVGVYATYGDTYGSTTTDAQGNTVTHPGVGLSGSIGLTGSHMWRHTMLDIEYRGYYWNYSEASRADSFDTSLNFKVSHQASSRLGIVFSEDMARVRNAGSLPISGLYGGGGQGYNPWYSALSANNLLDVPSLVSVSSAQLAYQATARLSFGGGGTAIISRQHLDQTVGVNGYVGSGNIAYRLTRYQTIGVSYSYSHLDYKGGGGNSNIHAAGLNYSARMGRFWELNVLAGASRLESLRPEAVPLDPLLAALLGVKYVFVPVHSVMYAPYGGVHLARSFRHASWTASYDRSFVSGALFSTVGYETIASYYNYTGLRRVSLQAGGGYYRYSGAMDSIGRYRSYGASGGLTVRVVRGLSATARVDGRRYFVSTTSFDRNIYSVSMGLAWNPGDYPVALW